MKRAVLLFAVATAHAETRPEYVGKAEGALLGAPGTLDPVAARSHAEVTLVELVYDTLYHIEVDGDVEPHIAAGPPEIDPAKHVAHVTIRKGIKFHDGTPLTAHDVAASLDRARAGQGKWALAPVTKVTATGDVLELALSSPVDVGLMLALAPTAVTKAGKPPGAKPIGSGPFQVDSIDRAKGRIVLVAFEDHFAGRPYLDRLVLDWYDNPDSEAKRFEIDETQLSARGVAQFIGGQPKFRATFVDGPKALLLFVGFGKKHAAVTGDVAFRQALDLALDRGALSSVNRGEQVIPAGEPVPVEAGGPPPTPLVRTGDVNQAKTALADAAKRVPALQQANLPNLTLEIAFESTRPDDREIAERVSLALSKLGIATTLSPVSASDLHDRVAKGTTDLWIGQLAAPVKAATSWPWWTAAFATAGDDWAGGKLATGDLTDAVAAKEFAARRPIVPLMFRGVHMWARSDLRGLTFDATGRPCFAQLFVFGLPSKTVKP